MEILLDQFESKELENDIAELLKHQSSIVFSEVIQIYFIKNGLAEIITYLSIASKTEQQNIASITVGITLDA